MADIESRYEELFLVAFRAARRVLGDREAAADIASEAVARALVRWRQVESHAPAWVTRVAINLALDQVRRRAAPSPETLPAAEEPSLDRILLVTELARLPRRQREALVLRFLLDLSEEHAAELLGVTVATIHTHVNRGMARIRRELLAEYVSGGQLP